MTLTVMSLPAGTSMVAGSIAKSLSDTSIVTGPSAAASPSPAPGEPPSPVHDAATSASTAAVAAIPLGTSASSISFLSEHAEESVGRHAARERVPLVPTSRDLCPCKGPS